MFDKFEKYDLPFHGVRLPEINTGMDNYEYLVNLCHKGFERKVKNGSINPNDSQKYTDQCKYELKVFKEHNLVDYVLLIHDVLSWCDKNKYPRGVSRGSAAGSLIFYLIGCNHIDPIKNNLLFTRFVSEARLQSKIVDGIIYLNGKSLPDYDADCSYVHRDKIIKYIENKYPNRTSKILTLTTFSGKILIKDCCKIFLEYKEEEAKHISDMIERIFGTVQSLEDAFKENKEFQNWVNSSYETTECYFIARRLENLLRSRGMHPSGVLISYDNISDLIPLELSTSKEVVSGFDMNDVANILLKGDFLGLRTADINYETSKLAGVDIFSIDINHPSIYEFLKNNDNYYGLFQISDGLTKKTCIDVQPSNIEELSCVLSLSRPGSFQDIPKYLTYKHEGKLESIHPFIDECLRPTGGVILYQEQINEICTNVYGIDPVTADGIRYAIGKKKKDEIEKFEPIVFQNGIKKGIPEEITKNLWKVINDSANYLFNKNHAFSYSYTTAISTYLKANHTKEFFLSLLNSSKDEPDFMVILGIISCEMKFFGIPLLPPHILKSDIDFKIEGDGIRFGLGTIKGISKKSIDKLQNFRHIHSNKFEIFSAAKECEIPINVLSSLVLSGSLDSMLTETRSKTMLEAICWGFLKEKERLQCMELGPTYNFDLFTILKNLNENIKDNKGKPIIKDSRRATIKKYINPYMKMYRENNKNQKLGLYFGEVNLLGFSYSTNLHDIFKDNVPDLIDLQNIKQLFNNDRCHFIGEIKEIKSGKSKEKKTPYLKFSLQDHTTMITCLMFNTEHSPNIDACEDNNSRLPKEGDFVICRGKKKDDVVFVDQCSIQDIVYFKSKKDLPKEEEKE